MAAGTFLSQKPTSQSLFCSEPVSVSHRDQISGSSRSIRCPDQVQARSVPEFALAASASAPLPSSPRARRSVRVSSSRNVCPRRAIAVRSSAHFSPPQFALRPSRQTSTSQRAFSATGHFAESAVHIMDDFFRVQILDVPNLVSKGWTSKTWTFRFGNRQFMVRQQFGRSDLGIRIGCPTVGHQKSGRSEIGIVNSWYVKDLGVQMWESKLGVQQLYVKNVGVRIWAMYQSWARPPRAGNPSN